MEIELTPEQDDLIRLGIEQGRYRDSADAIQRAMELWVERERVRLELVASLDEAADSIEGGEYTEYTEETLAQLPSDVAKRAKTRLAAQECASA
jgi:Arc/MetJ-type ribon-helix-helix transcriptional regulator